MAAIMHDFHPKGFFSTALMPQTPVAVVSLL
jgi:hypothetical protein